MLFMRFIVGNIFCTILACIILFLKKRLGNKASLRFHYRIWMLLLISLAIVLLPIRFFNQFHIGVLFSGETFTPVFPIVGQAVSTNYDSIGMTGISEAVTIVDHYKWTTVLKVIWGLGASLTLLVYAKSLFALRKIRKNSFLLTERERTVFDSCRERAGIRQKIVLLQSDFVKSPLSFGLRKSCIILPSGIICGLTEQEVEHIFLHELMHIRHSDILINYILCFEQAIYWCNPFIWRIFSQIRKDREAYCDWDVLNTYAKQDERLSYGYTLLRYAGQNDTRYKYIANDLCSSKEQVRYRIEKICEFQRENRAMVARGMCAVLVVSILSVLQLPVLAVFKNNTDTYTPPISMNIDEVDYRDIFGSNEGSAVIFDQQENHYLVYHLDQAEERIAPCSTFKIFSALNALEEGIITPEASLLPWDGELYEFQAWNCDQDLDSAMRDSVNWYFQALDAAAGRKELSAFYKEIGYGNAYIGKDIRRYWNGSSLKISPLEQVELLQKFYHNSFDFQKANIEAVKAAMLCSETSDNRLYGKTGTGKRNDSEVMGWFVGFVETSNNMYFFAVNLQNNSGANGEEAIQVTRSIFASMGIGIE